MRSPDGEGQGPRTSLVVVILSLALTPLSAAAQDRFGAAVSVTDRGEVVVLEPGTAVGPAVAVVYRLGADGAWARAARLPKLPGGYPGEALTVALTTGGHLLLFGSGDPDGREAGHLYRREGERWAPSERVPMDPRVAPDPAGLPAEGLDMPTLNRLMGPPPRTLALSPSGSRLAVAGGALPPGTVHVLRRVGDGWALEAELADGRPESAFGAALALTDDRLLVGALAEEPGGAVYLFERAGGGWTKAVEVVADSLESGGLLGAAVVLSESGDEAFAAAPGRSRVLSLVRGADGAWTRAGELTPPDEELGPGAFGLALALDGDRLLIGAPRADGGRGRVYAFSRGRARSGQPGGPDRGPAGGTEWTVDRTLTPDDLDRALFGVSVALRGELAVVGAPGAHGNDGRVAVFELDRDAGPTWLEPGGELVGVAGAQPIPCADGEAAGFQCEGVDLVSFLPLSALGAEPGERVTDIWGWTDPETRREYVLVGRTAGLAFVDITEPGRPRMVGLMPANPSGARDIRSTGTTHS